MDKALVRGLMDEEAIVEEAQKRYLTDAEFHARAFRAAQIALRTKKISSITMDAMPRELAIYAASIALLLSERPVQKIETYPDTVRFSDRYDPNA